MDRPGAGVDTRAIRALVAADVRAHTRWLKWPVIVFGLVGPVAIGAAVRDEHLLGAMLAYLNCLIAGYACVVFFRGQWLPGTIPLLFLPFTTLAWAFAPLYFAIFLPDHSYPLTGLRPLPYLYRFAHYEFVYMVFLLVYLAVVWPFVQWPRASFRGSRYTSNARALAYAAAGLMIGVMALHVFAKVSHVSDALGYLAEGLFKYYRALLLVVGAFYLRINRFTRYGLIAVLLVFAAFYTVASKREYAAFPLVSLVMGILFFSDMRPNLKVALVGGMLVGVPIYMLVGEAGRRVTEKGGGFENIQRRMLTFQVKGGAYIERTNPFIATMNRFFVTGGHSAVSYTHLTLPTIYSV